MRHITLVGACVCVCGHMCACVFLPPPQHGTELMKRVFERMASALRPAVSFPRCGLAEPPFCQTQDAEILPETNMAAPLWADHVTKGEATCTVTPCQPGQPVFEVADASVYAI